MFDVIRDCCDALLGTADDFWSVAAVTDCSFETGGSRLFRRALRSFADAGLPPDLTARLARGVNDHLVRLIEQRHPAVGAVRSNRGRGRQRPDIGFGPPGEGWETLAEVKVVYDLTTPAFYGHK